MKRILLLVFLFSFVFRGYSQEGSNTIIGIYGGGGLASSTNYNVALSGGLDFDKGIFYRTGIGFDLFYQQYDLLYDNEAYGVKNGTGEAGVTLLNKSSYIFLAPKLTHSIGRNQLMKLYVNVGVGFNMGGTETMRKWNDLNGAAGGNYDSIINTSANINKMLFRLGVGLKEYIHMRGKWWFSITEDCGFLTENLSKTADEDDPSRTVYSPNSLHPAYFSLQIGFSHSKN